MDLAGMLMVNEDGTIGYQEIDENLTKVYNVYLNSRDLTKTDILNYVNWLNEDFTGQSPLYSMSRMNLMNNLSNQLNYSFLGFRDYPYKLEKNQGFDFTCSFQLKMIDIYNLCTTKEISSEIIKQEIKKRTELEYLKYQIIVSKDDADELERLFNEFDSHIISHDMFAVTELLGYKNFLFSEDVNDRKEITINRDNGSFKITIGEYKEYLERRVEAIELYKVNNIEYGDLFQPMSQIDFSKYNIPFPKIEDYIID